MFGRARSLRNDRTLARARLLRSDRAGRTLGRYVATELGRARSTRQTLGHYVATELARARSLCSDRALAWTWLLRSDRIACMRGSFAMIELELFISSLSRILFRKNFVYVIFYKNRIFLLLSSRKYDFRGFSGVNSVMTVFDPNRFVLKQQGLTVLKLIIITLGNPNLRITLYHILV